MSKCNTCQKEFKVANWNKERKFCSHDCYWKSLRGKKNPEFGERMRKFYSQNEVWNKGKRGGKNPEHSKRMKELYSQGKIKPWNKGIPMKESTKELLSEFRKGRHPSPATEFKKGHIAPMKGKKLSEERKRRMSIHRLEQVREGKFSGKNHYNWQGGKSFEPYTTEFTKQLKREIRKRDDFKCVLCSKTEQEEKREFNCVLAIDHKDGSKENCSPENLRTLCKRCNSSEMQRLRKSTKECEVTN